MTEHEFNIWFAAKDLGHLEDVREFVEVHALQNGAGEDYWGSVKATVEMYLDDPELAAAFCDYRIARIARLNRRWATD